MGRPAIFKTCEKCGSPRISSAFAGASKTCLICRPPHGDPARAAAVLARDTAAKARLQGQPMKAADQCSSCRSPGLYAKGLCLRCYQREWRGKRSVRSGEVEQFLERQAAGRQFSEFLVTVAQPLNKCVCCWSVENVAPDSGGNFWCRKCAYYTFACGRCPAHNSAVFFPALTGNPVPAPPPEENVVMYTGEPVPVDDVDEP